MRSVVSRLWRQVAVVALLVGVDAAISLPIMGATYRPFSWMSIAPADAATLYPVIQDVSIRNHVSLVAEGHPETHVIVTAQVAPGANVMLQRSTNLLDTAGWDEVASTTATDRVILLIDTNPVSRAVFYRVKQLLGGTP
jgi:hypothetical protein